MSNTALYMLQISFNPKGLIELGRMLHLPMHMADTGYLVHCALGELFQKQAPSPYWVEQSRQQIRVLAYSSLDMSQLQELAKAFASPTVYSMVAWSESRSKPMPDTFPTHISLGFHLRVAPTVRLSSAIEQTGHKGFRKGAELDAYLAKTLRFEDESFERESVYKDWLSRRLDQDSGVQLESVQMERFQLSKVLRRTQGSAQQKRKPRALTLPDVTFKGTLTVVDGTAFQQVLQRGVGRHKGFGFGMLRLTRA